nr:type II secretion system F family protein [Nanoarchaeota archaeon]
MKLNIFKKKKGEEPLKKEQEEIKGEKKAPKEPIKEKKERVSKKEPELATGTKEEKKLKLDKPLPKEFKKLKGLKDKRLFSKKKKKKFSLRRFAKTINLQDYLEKAGLDTNTKHLTKRIFRINTFICLAITFLIIIANLVFKKGVVNLVVFLLGFWLTVFLLLLGLIWLAYLFYLDMRIFKRTRAVEAVFPDFLQLTSANISAGMPVDKALWYAVRPSFGVLAKEIETVAKDTMAGEDLSTALTNFARKYNSKVIQRSISLLLEGMAAGGEMADLLNKIAMNIEETEILKKEMAASVTTYVIFITFATILAAPVLFGLATQLLEVIKAITTSLASNLETSSSFFSFSFSSESIKANDFRLFSYLMLTISSFSSACIVSIIRKGRLKEGLTKIPIFIIISILIYTFASVIIKGMFGSML